MKRIRPRYRKSLYSPNWVKSTRDNGVRKYHNVRYNLEDTIRKAIRRERDEWRIPYYIDYTNEEQCSLPKNERKEKRFYYEDGDKISIRDLLMEDDSKFRSIYDPKIRVPSLKRSNREWANFYRTFPWIGADVAIGTMRFCGGAKLRYIPLFKKILDEEWPEDLKPWTEEEYDKLIAEGKMSKINNR